MTDSAQRPITIVDLALIVDAGRRYIAWANSGDANTCRWCGESYFRHHDQCPINALLDITTLLLHGHDAERHALKMAADGKTPEGGEAA
jgi:hypothetical protein